MLLKTYKNVFRNLSIRPYKIFLRTRISLDSSFKKTEAKLKLLLDTDMLLMLQKGIRRTICSSINRYVNDNNIYIKDYDKKTNSQFLNIEI